MLTIRRVPLVFLLIACSFAGRAGADEASRPVDYTRDVLPILTNNCYACHGPDEGKRKGKLRLDERTAAVKKAIVPGKAVASALIERVTSADPGEVMPPPASKKGTLTSAQVDVLRRWIDQGARFDVHWSYVKPARPPLPRGNDGGWPRNAIDFFVAAERDRRRLSPAPEADRITLIRRLSFDLTGLPPEPADVDAYVNDLSHDAYERLVDKLLTSKHHGERMALYWLDLVRYADTGGYHSDNHRDIYLYRDWVIDAFNRNMPFDRFTVEQLAGDLLPEASQDQKVASGYNRLLMTTEEGGAQPKEYMAKYAADRVRNVSSVWLAGTMGCAECHNHKFDPFTQRDFYSLAAYFADVREKPVGRQEQTPLPSPEQAARLKMLDEQIAPLQKRVTTQTPELDEALARWEDEMKKQGTRGLPKPVADALAVEPGKRDAKQQQTVSAHYRSIAPALAAERKELADLEAQRKRLLETIPSTLVSATGPARAMRILPRGNWLDDSGEVVSPAIPAFFAGPEVKGKGTRLDLALWLVSRDNPLTARVLVNRLWKLCLGQGLVRSVDDFGVQGTPPSHPQLLDWLAVELMESGWNVRHVLRLILTSATYRQSSVAHADVRERDPSNQWLARQGRFRLDAELVRDNALAVSGLLVRQVGGPSVKPYQPAGYWAYLNFPKRDWAHDHGAAQYRRGLYTYWQRTFLHPSLLAFDAPTREECTAERPRSSTPLQALVLLNDPTYVEAARVFAERTLREGGATVPERLRWAYRRAVSRAPRPEEQKLLEQLHQKHLDEYRAAPEAARSLLGAGEWPAPKDLDVAELAAWTSVARVVLNLHETITRN